MSVRDIDLREIMNIQLIEQKLETMLFASVIINDLADSIRSVRMHLISLKHLVQIKFEKEYKYRSAFNGQQHY